MPTELSFVALNQVVGKQLAGASRILYECKGTVVMISGDLELRFVDGEVILLRAAGDGEHLAIDAQAWRDPFAPPLDPQSEAFVRRAASTSASTHSVSLLPSRWDMFF